jgi:alanyl-tRNA synthetase
LSATVKLYDGDYYLKSFKARIIGIEGSEVQLDQTAFYPGGGGQASDTGFIGGVRVVDMLTSGGAITHVLETKPPFALGDEIEGEIDWERRYRIMKLHSAAHIMEHFLWERFGHIERLGSYVDDRKDRADYAYDGKLSAEVLKGVEDDSNSFLSEGHDVLILSDPVRPGIRIWRCGPIEMPCAGTHVRNTAEIGAIRLRRKNPGRGVERVETSLA